MQKQHNFNVSWQRVRDTEAVLNDAVGDERRSVIVVGEVVEECFALVFCV